MLKERNMKHTPETSVIMSAYNAENFLSDSIESILNQTYRDFEFIIVNDGSSDSTRHTLYEFQKKDNRIIIIENKNNIGLAKSLNIALNSARGKYVARMDADDLSVPARLEKQLAYLKKHSNIGLLGSYIKSIDEKKRITGSWVYPVDSFSIRWHLIFSNVIAHPSVVFRKELIIAVGAYNEKLTAGIDYDLWVRVSKITEISQIKEFLVMWRTHSGSMTYKNEAIRKQVQMTIVKNQVEIYLKRKTDDKEISRLYRLETQKPELSQEDVKDTSCIIEEIFKAFLASATQASRRSANYLVASKLTKLAFINIAYFPRVSFSIIWRTILRYCSIRIFFDSSLYLMLLRSVKKRMIGYYETKSN